MAAFAAAVWSGSSWFCVLRLRRRKQSSFTALFEPVAFASDVHRRGVMQQAVEDRGRDDRVGENRTPFAIAFVRSQDDAAPFIAGADQLKENSRTQLIQWQITHLVDDRHLWGEIDAQPAVQAAFSVSASEIGYQIVRCHEVRSLARLNGGFRQRYRETGFANAVRSWDILHLLATSLKIQSILIAG